MKRKNGHVYANCRVGTGFFDSEFYVKIGNSSSFVDREIVEVSREPDDESEVDGKVLTYPVKDKEDQVLIEMPGELAAGDSRIWVPVSEVSDS